MLQGRPRPTYIRVNHTPTDGSKPMREIKALSFGQSLELLHHPESPLKSAPRLRKTSTAGVVTNSLLAHSNQTFHPGK